MSGQVIDRAGKLSFNPWSNNGTACNDLFFYFLFFKKWNIFLEEHKMADNEITVFSSLCLRMYNKPIMHIE